MLPEPVDVTAFYYHGTPPEVFLSDNPPEGSLCHIQGRADIPVSITKIISVRPDSNDNMVHGEYDH